MPQSGWRLIPLLIAFAVPETLLSQPAFLVKDVVTGTEESSILLSTQEFTALGTSLFFVRDDGLHGLEVWKSDGTQAGATLLTDLCPGTCSSAPKFLTVSNGALFFFATDGAHSHTLWKSDGTAAGTVLVKANIFAPGYPGGLLDVDGIVYFAASDGVHGEELWKSDGTTAGTVLVKDINPGGSSYPRVWATDGGVVLFSAEDGPHGREPWVSDGTEAGTVMVKDVNPGAALSTPENFPYGYGRDAIALSSGVFVFRADDGIHGPELWKTDGTETGTTLLRDIHPTTGSDPTSLAVLGSAVYFAASDGTNGTELWKTDGTEAGTILLKDITRGGGSSPKEITASGNRIFFRAFEHTLGTELWMSDGTTAGTVLVKDVLPGSDGGLEMPGDYLHGITSVGGGILFFAADRQLWRSDGTEGGTVKVSNFSYLNEPAFFLVPASWAAVGGKFFFGTLGKPELWMSDGTTAGTVPVSIPLRPASSITRNFHFLFGNHSFAEHDNRFLFVVGDFDQELWTSDATSAGTIALLGAQSGTNRIDELTPVAGGPVFFYNGGILWKTDGTPAGTEGVSPDLSYPRDIRALGNSVLFSCDHPTFGWELCRSDGTPAGTGPIEDLRPGSDGSFPRQLMVSGDNVFFNANNGTSGSELFKSDGTEAGTTLVRDIWQGGDSFPPEPLADVGGTLFFSAFTPETAQELWKSDGTEAGTVLVKDIWPGPYPSGVRGSGFAAAVGSILFFVANDGVNGEELWKSDGTAAGTVLVKDIVPGSLSSRPFWLTQAGGRVYFAADDGEHGRELWVSDGTEVGTRMVNDILPGEGSSLPQNLQGVGHVLLFSATDGVHGVEAWRTNGTAVGTRMIQDIAPGTLSASPFYFTPAGNHVFFGADDNTTGFEPWAVLRSHVLTTFSDVPADFWAWPFVEALAATGLTGGCAPGQFCPEIQVSRAETAVFLLRGINGLDFVPPPATGTVFQDVPMGYWAAPWIEQFAQGGFTSGCNLAPPLYCPTQPLNRDEMAVFLLRAKHGTGYTPPPATGTVFSDVPAGYWAAPWIEQLAAEGITAGCDTGLYCPGAPVTRAQMAVFLTRTFSLPLP